jgi:uncharacterized membrane protein
MMEKFDAVISQASEKLIKAVEQYGPHATQLVLETGRVAALQSILNGVSVLIFGMLVYFLVVRPSYKKMKSDMGGSGDFTNSDPLTVLGGVALGSVVTAGSIIFAISHLLNVFAWIGLSRPEIFLAAKLLKL